MDLRIATCRPMPEPDVDEAPLLAACRAAGIRARMAAWNDADEDWDAAVPTVLRSTWDYPLRHEAFLGWIERAARAGPLWNPAAVLRWNAHKFYLRELERDGIHIVPTAFVARGAEADLAGIMDAHGWDEVVVKPAVSAGSFRTLRANRASLARGQEHLAALAAERDTLVQRYAPAVETSGERALVWIDGELTHSVRKSPRFHDDDESVSGALEPAGDERALALDLLARVRARFGPELLYGRVDVVRDEDGGLQVMELELLEPSLFLVQHPPALERLVAALARRLGAPAH